MMLPDPVFGEDLPDAVDRVFARAVGSRLAHY